METIKKIEDDLWELVVPNDNYPSAGYLLTLSREGFLLTNEITDVEFDNEETGEFEYKDIYYFKNVKNTHL